MGPSFSLTISLPAPLQLTYSQTIFLQYVMGKKWIENDTHMFKQLQNIASYMVLQ
jgi:hypothetical protein